MLYDLRRASAKHRIIDAIGLDAPGIEIYPVEEKFFINVNIPDDERHESRSPFFWSPDSMALVFADLYKGETHLVLVKIDDGRHTAHLLPANPSRLCRNSEKPGYVPLRSVRFTPLGSGRWEIAAEFDSFCRTDPLIVSSDDFSAAPVQKHRPLPPPLPVILTDKPPQLNR